MRVGIALGSNLDDRLLNLRMARESLLALHDPAQQFLSSCIYETQPVDCPSGSLPFLNAAIELSTAIPPLLLLERLLSIERQLGRPAAHPYHAPRTIDLDLLYCDDMEISCDALTLPHPRAAERLFVLMPLADICPERILPNVKSSARELCETLGLSHGAAGVKRFRDGFITSRKGL